MARHVEIRPKAHKDLAAIPVKDARRVAIAIQQQLGETMAGDIKKLTEHEPAYRLRVGIGGCFLTFSPARSSSTELKTGGTLTDS